MPIAYIYNFISSKLQYIDPDKIYKTKAKIITVGNITMGGAGKTPTSLSLVKILKNLSKHKVAILTRGYKGKLLGPIMVTEEHAIADVGDEALLIFKQAATCISKDRLQGIKFLENLGYDIIITDDGLQDQRFTKALTIMVVDSNFGFGNNMIFPAGPLRESIESGVKKVDLLVLIGDDKLGYKWPKTLPVLKASLVSKILLQSQKFIAFAGIGNPNKFFLSVTESEGKIVEKIAFSDHHPYTKKDMEYLMSLKTKHQASLITTEKDYTRISDEYKSQIQVLPVNLIWQNEEVLLKKLSKL